MTQPFPDQNMKHSPEHFQKTSNTAENNQFNNSTTFASETSCTMNCVCHQTDRIMSQGQNTQPINSDILMTERMASNEIHTVNCNTKHPSSGVSTDNSEAYSSNTDYINGSTSIGAIVNKTSMESTIRNRTPAVTDKNIIANSSTSESNATINIHKSSECAVPPMVDKHIGKALGFSESINVVSHELNSSPNITGTNCDSFSDKRNTPIDTLFISKYSNELPVVGRGLYHLYATNGCTIQPRSNIVIPVNIRCEFPKEYCMIVVNLRQGLLSTAGVIDSDYRGELMVICYNYTEKVIKLLNGEFVGMVVMLKCWLPKIKRRELDVSARGEGKFGSTGSF